MRLSILAAVLLISKSNALGPMSQMSGQTSGVGGPVSAALDSRCHLYRPLLVFTPTDKDRRFLMQVRWFAHGAFDMQQRQVLFVPLSVEREAKSWGVVLNSVQVTDFSQEEAPAARRRLGVGPKEFTVILIGKDGGEKFRSHAPVTIDRLKAVIDAMPMRQQEVRNGNSK